MNRTGAANHPERRREDLPGHEIRPMEPADLGAVSRIHCATMPDGLLARLGPDVLSHIYGGALTCPGTIALVAEKAGEVSGFLLATTDIGSLFRHILRTRLIPCAVQLLKVLVRDATLFRKMVATLSYPKLEVRGTPAELVAIGVPAGHRRSGQAGAMVEVLNRQFDQLGVRRYTVAVYSSNAGAQAFYERLGFRPIREFSLNERFWIRLELDRATTTSRLWSQADASYPVQGTGS